MPVYPSSQLVVEFSFVHWMVPPLLFYPSYIVIVKFSIPCILVYNSIIQYCNTMYYIYIYMKFSLRMVYNTPKHVGEIW
jgi:hypothetical protein